MTVRDLPEIPFDPSRSPLRRQAESPAAAPLGLRPQARPSADPRARSGHLFPDGRPSQKMVSPSSPRAPHMLTQAPRAPLARRWAAALAAILLLLCAGGHTRVTSPSPREVPPEGDVAPEGAVAPGHALPPGPCRLAVLIIFDQMRADYLERWQPLWGDGGLRRLQAEGAWFTNCH